MGDINKTKIHAIKSEETPSYLSHKLEHTSATAHIIVALIDEEENPHTPE